MSQSMTVLEVGVRGGAIALLLVLAIVAWRDTGHTFLGRYSALFDVLASVVVVEIRR